MTTIDNIKCMTNMSARDANDFFLSYGFEIEKNFCNYALCYYADGVNGEVITECEADNDNDALIKLVKPAIEYAELNEIAISRD